MELIDKNFYLFWVIFLAYMTINACYKWFLGGVSLVALGKSIIYLARFDQVITKNNLYLLMLYGIILFFLNIRNYLK